MFTDLESRRLWFDGTNQVAAERIAELLMRGCPIEKIVADESTAAVEEYNLLADDPIQINKSSNDTFVFDWKIPAHYINLDLRKYLESKLVGKTTNYANRVEEELVQIEKRNISMLFKTIIYLTDELRLNNKVWGVGRGSSCASLVLYLIGLHCVDPIKYNIPASEFFHN